MVIGYLPVTTANRFIIAMPAAVGVAALPAVWRGCAGVVAVWRGVAYAVSDDYRGYDADRYGCDKWVCHQKRPISHVAAPSIAAATTTITIIDVIVIAPPPALYPAG